MQVTFKQLEAFMAVVEHGTFEGAARHIGLAQSAISRQIQELEQWFGFELFDRTGRTAKPNSASREVLEQIRHVLLHKDVFDSCLMSNEVVRRKLRIGITELTALTWLPSLVKAITLEFPRVSIEPVVDLGLHLKEQLVAGRLDIVVLPDAFLHDGLIKVQLYTVENGWYCAPQLAPHDDQLGIQILSTQTLLAQGKQSGSGVLMSDWLKSQHVKPGNQIPCNSLVALIGLAISGLGITYLPHIVANSYVQSGQLVTLAIHPTPPNISYVAMARADSFDPVSKRITDIISNTCQMASLTAYIPPMRLDRGC